MLGNFKKATFRVLCLGCALIGGVNGQSQPLNSLWVWV